MKRFLLIVSFLMLTTLSLSKGNLPPVFATERNNVAVTADVGPQPRDYQLSETITSSQTSPIRQDTAVTYTITYGASSSAAFATRVTITADWRSSDAMTNIPILDYVTGSATLAYGNTVPVVDLTKRQITWSIPSLPAGTVDQTVRFTLRTNSNYIGDNTINFTVKTNMSNQYMTMEEQSVTKSYKYDINPIPTNDTITTTPTPTTTQTAPTPTKSPTTPLSLGNISFTHITQNDATVHFTTTNPASKIIIKYGTAINNLSHILTLDSGGNITQNIELEQLIPEKTYYFQIMASDGNKTVSSEIFSFQTAEISTPPSGDNNVIIITSNGSVLISDVKEKDRSGTSVALVTTDTPYEITYRLKNNIALRSIEAVMRQAEGGSKLSKVLAANESVVLMQEKEPQVYVAKLRTDISGKYDVFVRIKDTKGNVIEEKVAVIKIMPLLSVTDSVTRSPIEDARIFISFFNTQTNRFEPISSSHFEHVDNPSYTNIGGTSKLLLPPGKYRIDISAFGYAKKTVTFVLSANAGEDFPEALLTKDQTNIIGYLKYYGTAITDLATNITAVVGTLSLSVRFFNLLATFILAITIFVTFVFFSIRTRVYLRLILPYFTHHIKTITQKHPLGTFCATITDEQGKRLQGALISVLDDITGELLTSIMSNTVGICYLFNPKEHKNLKLLIIKQGYQPKTVAVESDIAETANGLTIVLKKGQKPTHAVFANTWRLIEAIGGRFFEVSLFVSLMLEVLFLSVYGFGKTLPFFALSFFNLLLWIMYQKEKQDRKIFRKT